MEEGYILRFRKADSPHLNIGIWVNVNKVYQTDLQIESPPFFCQSTFEHCICFLSFFLVSLFLWFDVI